MTDQTIQDILYLIDAWERGADAKDYPNEIAALRQALAQPEQEPVAWLFTYKTGQKRVFTYPPEQSGLREHCQPLYLAPPSKPWVSLTDEEIVQIVRKRGWGQSYFSLIEIIEFTRDNEAALRSKNT